MLATHFLEKHRLGLRPAPAITPAVSAALLAWEWPGNVRELENAILRAVHLSQSDSIEIADLGLPTESKPAACADSCASKQSFKAAKRRAIALFEKEYLTRLMAEQDGNISQAARAAGKDRSDLGKLLKKHRLDAKVFRIPADGPAR